MSLMGQTLLSRLCEQDYVSTQCARYTGIYYTVCRWRARSPTRTWREWPRCSRRWTAATCARSSWRSAATLRLRSTSCFRWATAPRCLSPTLPITRNANIRVHITRQLHLSDILDIQVTRDRSYLKVQWNDILLLREYSISILSVAEATSALTKFIHMWPHLRSIAMSFNADSSAVATRVQ